MRMMAFGSRSCPPRPKKTGKPRKATASPWAGIVRAMLVRPPDHRRHGIDDQPLKHLRLSPPFSQYHATFFRLIGTIHAPARHGRRRCPPPCWLKGRRWRNRRGAWMAKLPPQPRQVAVRSPPVSSAWLGSERSSAYTRTPRTAMARMAPPHQVMRTAAAAQFDRFPSSRSKNATPITAPSLMPAPGAVGRAEIPTRRRAWWPHMWPRRMGRINRFGRGPAPSAAQRAGRTWLPARRARAASECPVCHQRRNFRRRAVEVDETALGIHTAAARQNLHAQVRAFWRRGQSRHWR